MDLKKNVWTLPTSLMALGTPCRAGQQPQGQSQPEDSWRVVEEYYAQALLPT